MASATSTFDNSENPLSESSVWDSPGSGLADLKKVSGAVQCTATSTDCAMRHSLTVAGDHYSKITISVAGSGTNAWGVCTRVQTNGDCYALYPTSATTVELYLVGGTTPTFTGPKATYQTTGTFAAGDTIELRSVGSTHTCYHNGAAMSLTAGSTTEATLSGGKTGIAGYQTTLGDLFTAWEGGDFNYSVTAAQGSFTLSGQAAALTRQYPLTAAQGSYTLSGQAATLTYSGGNPILAAAQGSYALTGQAANFPKTSILAAVQGSFALGGQDAALTVSALAPAITRELRLSPGPYGPWHPTQFQPTLRSRELRELQALVLTAAQGSFTLNGQTAALIEAHFLTAAQGAFALSGQAATFARGVGISAGQGSYTLTGQAAAFSTTARLAADQGSYALSGQTAGLLRGYPVVAAQGAFTLSGQAATSSRTYVLAAGTGDLALRGQRAQLLKPGDIPESDERRRWHFLHPFLNWKQFLQRLFRL